MESPQKRKKDYVNRETYKKNIFKQAIISVKEHINWVGQLLAAKNNPSTITKR